MTAMTINLPDDVYDRIRDRATERGVSPQEEVVEIVSRHSGGENGEAVEAARLRMRQLFDSVHGFKMSEKIPREDLYDRGRVH